LDSLASRSWAANRLGFIMAESSRLVRRHHAMVAEVFRGALKYVRQPATAEHVWPDVLDDFKFRRQRRFWDAESCRACGAYAEIGLFDVTI